MNSMIKKAILSVLITGIATFIAIGIMAFKAGEVPKPAEFPNKPGFSGAMYWFELANNGDEIFQLLGDPGSDVGKHLREVMDITNQYDYLFMVCYSLLFAALFFFHFSANPGGRIGPVSIKGILILGLILAGIMLLSDVFENIQLLKLTGYSAASAVPREVMTALKVSTRLKWSAIFISCLLLTVLYVLHSGMPSIPGIVISALYFLPAAMGLIALFVPGMRSLIEIASNIVGAAWLASIVHAGILFFRGKET